MKPTKAGVIVLTKSKKSKPVSIAMVKGHDTLTYGPGKWGFPKGDIDRDESDIQGALREFKEETGVDILEPLHDVTLYVPDKGNRPKIFFIDIVDYPFVMNRQKTEVSEIGWKTINELKSMKRSELTFDVRLLLNILDGNSRIPAQKKLKRLIDSL